MLSTSDSSVSFSSARMHMACTQTIIEASESVRIQYLVRMQESESQREAVTVGWTNYARSAARMCKLNLPS